MDDGESRERVELAVAALLERGLDRLGSPASPTQLSSLTRLVLLISEWAGRISLTGHRDPLELAGNLVLDAIALGQSIPELDSAKRLTDLGSGVGFPGFPIAILRPHLEVVLVESRLKRHHLQREVCRQLELTRVAPTLGRAEDVSKRVSDVVVAQAMTRPRAALELMRPWVRAGGIAVLPASPSAEPPALPDGFSELVEREYRVPEIDRVRRLWIARVPPVD